MQRLSSGTALALQLHRKLFAAIPTKTLDGRPTVRPSVATEPELRFTEQDRLALYIPLVVSRKTLEVVILRLL